MNKYSVVLVDDEREIIEGIIQKVDFESLGLLVVGAAENGEEAFQLSLKLKPDIVISDIIMPFMDGLTLGEKLKEELPNTKIILFSGHDDLEYAHRAIKELDIKPIVKPIRGGTDGSKLSFMGLPCPNIFAGGLNFHGKYEFLPIPALEKASKVIVKIAELVAKEN